MTTVVVDELCAKPDMHRVTPPIIPMPEFNLDSRSFISKPCDLADLEGWLSVQLESIEDSVVWSVVRTASENVSQFVPLFLRGAALGW